MDVMGFKHFAKMKDSNVSPFQSFSAQALCAATLKIDVWVNEKLNENLGSAIPNTAVTEHHCKCQAENHCVVGSVLPSVNG